MIFPRKLDSTLRVDVPRPKKSRSKKDKEDEEEILVIKGMELDRNKFVKFDVFVNGEDDPGSRPDNTVRRKLCERASEAFRREKEDYDFEDSDQRIVGGFGRRGR